MKNLGKYQIVSLWQLLKLLWLKLIPTTFKKIGSVYLKYFITVEAIYSILKFCDFHDFERNFTRYEQISESLPNQENRLVLKNTI